MKEKTCHFCHSPNSLIYHHIIPRRFLGSDSRKNMIWVCQLCHGELESKTRQAIFNKSFNDQLAETLNVYDKGKEDLTEEGKTSHEILMFIKEVFIPTWEEHKKKTVEELTKGVRK